MTNDSDGYHGNKYFVGRLISIRVEPSPQKTAPVSNKIRFDSHVLSESIVLVLFAVSAKFDAIDRPLAITVFGPRTGIAFIGPHRRLRSMAMDTKKDKHVSLDGFMHLNRSIEAWIILRILHLLITDQRSQVGHKRPLPVPLPLQHRIVTHPRTKLRC